MAAPDTPAAVSGSTTTVKTMADGTLRVSVDIEPRHAQAAFAMFGAPGTAVALARLTPKAAVDDMRRQAQQEVGNDYGHHYAVLYKRGWFHNPKVIAGFEVDPNLSPDERIEAIKQRIYLEAQIESLTELEPHFFMQVCALVGVVDTVPRELREAA
ncbi:hypothetical protein [Bradyrhizobium elkanii]|uniref:hypothetical protein n=1 Tax=Bradyrhizobium elkanii TaxID=29448 RepID=UPI0035126200